MRVAALTLQSPRLRRIGAVVGADVLTRIRRPSSVAVLVVLCVLSYRLVPAVSSGRTLLLVDGHRALLTSSAIALGTASFASVLLAMLGFYLVSNAVHRDTVTRVGSVVAAMPVRNAEYLSGKFLGNVVFLGLVACAYMLNVMVMHLLRAEGPLQPVVYVTIYVAVMGPSIVVTSALALLFECVQPLSGRVGDIVYFLVWGGIVSFTALDVPGGGWQWFHFFDVLGMLFMMHQINDGGLAHAAAIGGMPFDPRQSPWSFPGIHWDAMAIGVRLSSASLAVPLFFVATRFFNRFDPASIGRPLEGGRRSLLGQVNRLLKPVTRLLLWGISPTSGAIGFGRIALGEVILTFLLSPLTVVLLVAINVWGSFAPPHAMLTTVLPFAFLGIVVAITDVVTRDDQAGMIPLLSSIPKVKPAYLVTKCVAASAVALLFVVVPLIRLAVSRPEAALSLGIGTLFVVALATSLGYLTGSGKAFAGCFLLFLYVARVINNVPAFDFAGLNGVATGSVRLGYLCAAGALMGGSVIHRRLAFH